MKDKNPELEKSLKMTKEKCGIIMPISQLDECNEQHWIDVKSILIEAIESSDLEANLVSNADDIGIIQKRIIQNIYDNPIIVCDVSGKNPNVMFELGLRLAFDKPTIIVKDDKTSYSFDTSPIEHLTYPRDLRFNKIIDFKKELSEKILGTLKKAKEDKNFSTFLKHFGKFTVAKLETTEVSKEEFILEELRDIRYAMSNLSRERNIIRNRSERFQNELPLDSHDCASELLDSLRIIIKDSKNLDFLKPENRNLLRKKIFSQRSIFPDCFNMKDNDAPCFKILEEQIMKLTTHNKGYIS